MGLNWASIETCFLDMDGTILDLYFDHQVWHVELPRLLAKRNGQTFSEAKSIIQTITNSEKGSLKWYDLDYWKKKLNIDIDDIEIACSDLIAVRNGAAEFLEGLKQKDLTICLATNAHPRGLKRKLKQTGIGVFFDHIISSHDIGAPKESLRFWQAIKKEIPYKKCSTFLLDDNMNVLYTAQKFGIKHVYGIQRPNTKGAIHTSNDFELIDDYFSFL